MPRSNQISLRLYRGPAGFAGAGPLQPTKREPSSRRLLPGGRQSPSRRFFLDHKVSHKGPPHQKALLVEIDQQIVEKLRLELSKLGFSVNVACSGHDCAQRLRCSSFDVLILSADVVSQSDEQVLERIRKTRLKPSTIVAILGGHQDSVEQLNIPHDLHLASPLDLDQLVVWVTGEWFCSSF